MCDAWNRTMHLENQSVCVCTRDTVSLHGHVHAIDPETGNVILLTRGHVHLIFAHDIENMTAEAARRDTPKEFPTSRKREDEYNSSNEGGLSLQGLLSGLERRRIESKVVKDGNDEQWVEVLEGRAIVKPPYRPRDVCSEFDAVGRRMRVVVGQIVAEESP